MRKAFFLLFAAIFCGCGILAEPEAADTAEPEMVEPVVAIKPPEPVEYTVFVETSDYKLALYEPPKGAYLGAYILSNPAINYDMARFEEITGKPHALYSYYTSMGSNFPITWLLSCLSLHRTPNIIFKPASLDQSDADIEKSARDTGEFYVPMFVQLAPVDNKYDPEKYKAYFKRAREMFKAHASNAAIVWTVKAEDVYDCIKYYPGDEYVDWVGISLYQTITPEKDYDKGLFEALDYFYYSFQKTKPIMLSEYAVSHLSSLDSVYRNSQAAEEITRVYKLISESYPRIKSVIYMDINSLSSSKREVRDNFALLEEKEILSAYKAATAGYLSNVDIQSTGDVSRELIRSPFKAVKIGSEIFISRSTMEKDLNISGATTHLDIENINGQEYFNSSGIRRVEIDSEHRTVLIKK